jgi:folate-binding Fe-S cluster repair protein YgfZ/Tfp pilus assembly protein PilF
MSLLLENIIYKECQITLDDFDCIEVKGEDTTSFLHTQTTNDIQRLENNQFHINTLVDIKGRLLSWYILYKHNDNHFDLFIQKNLVEATLERLALYHVSEDVEYNQINKSFYLNLNSPEANGAIFNSNTKLVFEQNKDLYYASQEEVQSVRLLSGYDDFMSQSLITNTYLMDIAVSHSKGCYPGAETVSKIVNNRGAAFYPVCLVGEQEIPNGKLEIEGKKIGEVSQVIKLENTYYHYVYINRENRISNKKIKINNDQYIIKYFPLFPKELTKRAHDLYDYALVLFHEEKLEESLKYLKQAIVLNPSFEDAYEVMGVIYGRMEKFETAIEWMHKLSEVAPKSVMAHTNLSLYYMKIGKIEEAENHKSEATFKTFEKLGDEAEAKKKREESLKQKEAEKEQRKGMYRQVLEIDGEDPLANYGLGEYMLEDGEYEKAKEHLIMAIQGDPKYSVAYLALGKTYKALEKIDLARETFSKGIEIASKKGDMMPANEMQSLLNNLEK